MDQLFDKNLQGLNPAVSNTVASFVWDIISEGSEQIHSINLVGSAITADFRKDTSDINSIIILHQMSFNFIDFLAKIGEKYGKKQISAPLVITTEYLFKSLDVFPIEFHDFKLIHRTIIGEDILKDIVIEKGHLRVQCEREIKVKLIGLIEGYISCRGEKKLLSNLLIDSFRGLIPLLRAVIFLIGKEPPILRTEVIKVMKGLDPVFFIFEELLMLKDNLIKPSFDELTKIFRDYFVSLDYLGKVIDDL
ncbi:MAG: hypothetical protein N3A59_02420 [Thermodesulfovibrionales bacterium]|nr:hypothetical protein [Thermodesulfovibrionales bacterium]